MVKRLRKTKADKHTDLSKIRHSASHILAEAVLALYPGTKFGIGPATNDGFYYDFEFVRPISEEALPRIEAKMKALIAEGRKFSRSEKTIATAIKHALADEQPYKVDLLEGLKEKGHKKVSFYTSGDFTDLCEGPHVKDTKEIGAIKLLSLAGAYWRGNENNAQLTRIYGTAFATQADLDECLLMLEEAKKRDHRILGEKLELFSFHQEGPGFPFWHPKGTWLFHTILAYMRALLAKYNYGEIMTPPILNEELWHKSGHWDNYKENMYFTEIDETRFAVKPMNCPGGLLVFNKQLHSYKELPMRLAEFGLVHRHEMSGVLHGLFRVRAFTQDDAHVYCMPDQIKDEIKILVNMIQDVYKDFGFTNYHIELSTRPAKSIGSDEIWDKAEKIMRQVDKEENLHAAINEGDGAFYGPKFDFHINDSLGRNWQMGTVQLDFSMPMRLGATYIDKDGSKQTPIMIHRAILGSLERFIGILIEHYAGALPVWLAPVQAKVLPISDKSATYVKKLSGELATAGVRFEIDDRNESIGRKIRDAEMSKIPYMLVVGDKEVQAKKVAVRHIHEGDIGQMALSSIIKRIGDEVDKKK
ncbi:MAG: threonine--tRNA ligase [Patescibacteria group bacterium]|nr:threonine--tRNA ligase [Patescibacteria group bacterium]